MKIVGVDIGGTSIKLGVADESGNLQHFYEYETEASKGGNYVLQTIIENIERIGNIDAIGISTLGQIDREKGMITQESPNIPQTAGLKIKSILESHFNIPVKVENDVNAAALGESHFGIGKKLNDYLYVAYGTGIGGAIVVDSEIYYGKSGFAAEFGHMITHPLGRKCNCGLLGCYERYASTSALVRDAMKLDKRLSDGRAIFAAYDNGNKQVEQLINHWVSEIVFGLVSLIHIFNPSTIIIGGGIMEQDALIEMISKEVKENILVSFNDVKILKASLGNKAGVLGAIALHVQ